jgi:hypothetical protein
MQSDEIPDRHREQQGGQLRAPVLQGESGPQDGNQCSAPAFPGHSFAACIHFLVGRFLSPPVRRCKETKFLTVSSESSSPLRLRSGRYRQGPSYVLRWPRVVSTVVF